MSSVIEIVLQGTDKASDVVNGLQGALGGLGGIAQGALTVGFGVAAAGAGALVAGLGLSISEALDAQKVQAQLAAVLESTGGQAGVTADMANDLATALSKTSTYSDDAILAGENLLLTFTNIGSDVFPAATQTLVDMAAAMGGDVKANAIQLGKALNNPVEGMAALSRVGVTFTEEQKAVIQSLVDTGDVAGAQALILEELNKEFGGSAAAQAQTISGQFEVMKNSLLNVAEGIGTSLLPAGQALIDNFLTPVLPIIEAAGTALGGLISDFISSGGDLGLAADNLREGFAGILPQPVIDAIANFLLYLRDEGPGALATFQTAIQPLVDAVGNVVTSFSTSLPMVQTYVADMVTFVTGQFNTLSPTLITNVSTMLNSIAAFWTAHGETIMQVINFVFRVITTTIGGAITLVSGLIAAGLQLINGDWEGAWNTIVETLKTFLESALSIVGTNLDEFITTWTTNFEMAKLIVTTVFDNIVSDLQAKIAEFIAIGTAIIDGIKSGINDAVSGLVAAAIGAAQAALQGVKDVLGINSPSVVFAGIGKNIMAGMAMGIDASANLPYQALENNAAGLTQAVTHNNYSLTMNSNARTEDVANNFRVLAAMGGI